tara:strand:- start:268921 stop:271461 length:2541 start_codon:yes stop_codon:yes gene_type:complete
MVQFKDVFIGTERRTFSKAASSQKCLRVSGKHNDLETVGKTARHHTFFEMLGNFSFGDYFKEQAIEYGWKFLVDDIKLPVERLYATVYDDDDEAADLWIKSIGLSSDKVVRFGEKENFWSMGDTGPCGPCSEIHFDRGPEYACENPSCGIDCDCDRFLEIWNLVFMQYERSSNGKMTLLPNPSIDTGMGLERLVSVLQGKDTNFETDLILPIIDHMEEFTEADYLSAYESDVAFRVIGDHARAVSFLMADGIMPSSEGRGYVLRRILRRALRYGWILGVKEPFLHRLTATAVQIMQEVYPELGDAAKVIRDVTLNEEKSFSATLDHGMLLLTEMIEKGRSIGKNVIAGDDAFKLYDTYGFPLDLAQEVAKESQFTLDTDGFNKRMNSARVEARKSWKGAGEASKEERAKLKTACPVTEFIGYEVDNQTTNVLAIFKDGGFRESAREGETIELLLASTPFYAESGGQSSDIGLLSNDNFAADVVHVTKLGGKHYYHKVQIIRGEIKVGEKVFAEIDIALRDCVRKNHSATHLLHAALRQVLGAHVKQAGSLVGFDRLRFDYTHFAAPSLEDVRRIELAINEKIMENLEVETVEKSIDEAVEDGAIALFGEKYDEAVRVVSMGEFSKELCGGTHTKATGTIGLCKIISENGVATGVRRIEALTGSGALKFVHGSEDVLTAVGHALKSPAVDLVDTARKLVDKNKELEKQNKKLNEKMFSDRPGLLDSSRYDTEDIIVGEKTFKVMAVELDGADTASLRTFVDSEKNRLKTGVVVAGSKTNDKAMIAVGVTKNITSTIRAGDIVKQVAAIVGGNGGGRPDFAQAGGRDPEKLGEAISSVQSIVKKLVDQ